MIKCPVCGEEFSEEVQYCKTCGAALNSGYSYAKNNMNDYANQQSPSFSPMDDVEISYPLAPSAPPMPAPSHEPPKKGKGMLIVIISLSVALVLALALVAYFVIGDDSDEDNDSIYSTQAQSRDEDEEKPDIEQDNEEDIPEDVDVDDTDIEDGYRSYEVSEVEEYVELYRDELIEGFLSGLGMDGEADVYAIDEVVYYDVYLTGVDGLSDEEKASVQDAYDSISNKEKADILDEMRVDIPQLEGMVCYILEEDGDYVAALEIYD